MGEFYYISETNLVKMYISPTQQRWISAASKKDRPALDLPFVIWFFSHS